MSRCVTELCLKRYVLLHACVAFVKHVLVFKTFRRSYKLLYKLPNERKFMMTENTTTANEEQVRELTEK